MNVNKFKGKTTQTAMQIASAEELTQHYNNKDKKRTNEDINVKTSDPIQSASVSTTDGNNFKPEPYVGILSYPLDIDPQQDHLKITKYKYTRTSVQASRPARTKTETIKYKKERKQNKQQLRKFGKRYTTVEEEVQSSVAADSVKGKERLGSVILPMP